MHSHQFVEDALARLIPPGLSEGAQREMEDLIDELAAEAPEVEFGASGLIGDGGRREAGGVAGSKWRRWGIAAALTGGIWLASDRRAEDPVLPDVADVGFSDGIVLVGESDRVSAMVDEGWSEDCDGAAMRTMRLSVVEENSFLDEETGIVMQVSRGPREELLYMPVTTF